MIRWKGVVGLALLLILFVFVGERAYAAEGSQGTPIQAGKVGLLVSPPITGTTRIGLAFHAHESFAIKPSVAFSYSRVAYRGPDQDSYSQLALGVGFDGYFGISQSLYGYGGALFEYSRLVETEEFDGFEDKFTGNFLSVVPRIGLQYMPASQFGLYGEVGLATTFGKVTSEEEGLEDEEIAIFQFTTQAAIGVLFYVN